MSTKINQLIKLWKPGLVFTSSFLKKQGINYDQQSAYKKSGWLESIGSGAFKREGDLIKWSGGLYALQEQLDLKLHLGGKSALLKQGYSHYAYAHEPNLFLFISRDNKLPKWFRNYEWSIKLELSRTALLPADLEESYTTNNIDGFDIDFEALLVCKKSSVAPSAKARIEVEPISPNASNTAVDAIFVKPASPKFALIAYMPEEDTSPAANPYLSPISSTSLLFISKILA